MIQRKLLMATAIIASAVTTACSDTTAPKNGPGVSPVAAKTATVVATIKGRGTAEMQPPGLVSGKTVFSTRVKLQADGSATGFFDCIDVFGSSTLPGDISGEVISWSTDPDGSIVLNVIGTFVPFLPPDGHPGTSIPASFTVKIQKFGGKGVGHWTLAIPIGGSRMPCVELLTSGRIVIVYRDDDDRDDGVGE
jgi:hypothetical protein